MAWKTTIFSPADGPELTGDEYSFLLEESALWRIFEEKEFRGFAQPVDSVVSLLEFGLREVKTYSEEERKLIEGIIEKLKPHAGKWFFVE